MSDDALRQYQAERAARVIRACSGESVPELLAAPEFARDRCERSPWQRSKVPYLDRLGRRRALLTPFSVVRAVFVVGEAALYRLAAQSGDPETVDGQVLHMLGFAALENVDFRVHGYGHVRALPNRQLSIVHGARGTRAFDGDAMSAAGVYEHRSDVTHQRSEYFDEIVSVSCNGEDSRRLLEEVLDHRRGRCRVRCRFHRAGSGRPKPVFGPARLPTVGAVVADCNRGSGIPDDGDWTMEQPASLRESGLYVPRLAHWHAAWEVLELCARGLDAAECAAKIGVSESTVSRWLSLVKKDQHPLPWA